MSKKEFIEELDYIDFAPYDLSVEERRKLDVGDVQNAEYHVVMYKFKDDSDE